MSLSEGRAHWLGVGLGVFAGIAWGAGFVAVRWLVHLRGIGPTVVVFWRFAFAVPLLWAAARLLPRQRTPLARRDLPEILGLSLLGMIMMANFGFAAARFTTNANITLIINANAVFIAIIVMAAGMKVPARQLAGVAAGLAGIGIIALAKSPSADAPVSSNILGIALATLASLSWALYTVAGGRMVSKYGGVRVTFWCVTAGALMQLCLAAPVGLASASAALSPGEWWVLVFIGLVPTALAFTAWFVARRLVSLTTLGPTQYVGTVAGIAFGAMLLGEKILPAHLVGGTLILAGLHLAVKRSSALAQKGEKP